MTTADVVAAARARLGPVGVWLGALRTEGADAGRYAAHRTEALGYGSLWIGEAIGGKEAFVQSAILLAATSTIVAGIGSANAATRHPAVMQGAAATIGSAWPGRFVLGVGASHASARAGNPAVHAKPLEQLCRYLSDMDIASGAGPVAEPDVPRVLAGLRPGMLAVARDQSDGAHTYFVPASHTPAARAVLGPDRLLITEQAVILSTDATEARGIARRHTHAHLRLPHVADNLRALGYPDDDLSAGGSDRLVDAVVAWGDEAAIARRVREHLDGGADHVLLRPLGGLAAAVGQLERLSSAVLPG